MRRLKMNSEYFKSETFQRNLAYSKGVVLGFVVGGLIAGSMMYGLGYQAANKDAPPKEPTKKTTTIDSLLTTNETILNSNFYFPFSPKELN